MKQLLLAVLIAAASGCCTSVSGVLLPPKSRAGSGQVLAGAAKVDLTPPPGYPMGGHGPAASTSRGVWTRLWARAIYLEDPSGRSLALVSADLFCIPGGLGDRVAELLRADPATWHIGRESLLLAATHTHQSPGNFSTWKDYNQFGSNRPGFDPALFEFLARRIVRAVTEAAANPIPSTVRFAENASYPKTTPGPGALARNRSFEAFALNPESADLLAANAGLPTGPLPRSYPHLDVYKAIDPRLSILRIDRAAAPFSTVALAAVVAVHPTSMSPRTQVYNGDFFGVAGALCEERANGALVAIFNGPEGDVSPAWEFQDRRDAQHLGEALAAYIDDLSGKAAAAPPLKVDIGNSMAWPKLADVALADGRKTADHPMAGVGMLGGAEDGRTLFYELGWREGVRDSARHDLQGSKHPALDLRLDPRIVPWYARWLLPDTKSFLKPDAVPNHVPIALHRIGPLVVAALPGEFTTVLGLRIRADLKKETGSDIVIVGLSNEYASYVTTAEEYEAQHYEGCSTLYGPAQGLLYQEYLVALARKTLRHEPRESFDYSPGSEYRFFPADVGERPFVVDDGLSQVLLDLKTGLPIRGFPRIEWEDVTPSLDVGAPRVIPRVKLEVERAGAWTDFRLARQPGGPLVAQTSEGIDFVTVALEVRGDRTRWACFWMPPVAKAAPLRLRFVADLSGGTTKTAEFAW